MQRQSLIVLQSKKQMLHFRISFLSYFCVPLCDFTKSIAVLTRFACSSELWLHNRLQHNKVGFCTSSNSSSKVKKKKKQKAKFSSEPGDQSEQKQRFQTVQMLHGSASSLCHNMDRASSEMLKKIIIKKRNKTNYG